MMKVRYILGRLLRLKYIVQSSADPVEYVLAHDGREILLTEGLL
jgi:hypothetical protein